MKVRWSGMGVGEASGSLGTSVASHNRSGSYLRLRAVPTKATSTPATIAKGVLSLASKTWGTLTDDQRRAWATWSQNNPIVDRLGDKRILAGSAACTKLNINCLNTSGNPITDPPAVAAPTGLTNATATFDTGAGTFNIVFTPTPLGADNYLYVWAAVVNSPGITYVENLYKLVKVTAANVASPLVGVDADIEARFGALAVGQTVYYKLQVVDGTTGLVSGMFPLKGTVVHT
jgi:hypothetical protein